MSGSFIAHEAAALLDLLDGRSQHFKRQAERRDPRQPYRRELKLLQQGADGWTSETWAFARDLSTSGLGCLHLEPLAAGTAVLLHLPAGEQGTDELRAVVVHCAHVQDDWHLLGLRFETRIDPERYAQD